MLNNTYAGITCREAVEAYAEECLMRNDLSGHYRFKRIAARLPDRAEIARDAPASGHGAPAPPLTGGISTCDD